ENSGLVELVKIRYTRMVAPMMKATAMPKKIGRTEKCFSFTGLRAAVFFTFFPFPVIVSVRRACWVLMPLLVPDRPPDTTLLMVLLGASWVLYSYSKRMLGFCLNA